MTDQQLEQLLDAIIKLQGAVERTQTQILLLRDDVKHVEHAVRATRPSP